MKKKILFVSNCFGEDRSAALIARELERLYKENGIKYKVIGASLISDGRDYTSNGIELLFSSYIPPSGGFPTGSLKGFFSDIFHTPILFQYIKKLKSVRDEIELCVVIGDVSLLFLTRQALKNSPLLFLSLPKSDYIEPHYKIEEWYIRKNTNYFFTRDAFTAKNLNKKGVKAYFLGNPIMDDLDIKNCHIKIGENKPTIGILPGSRDEAYDNLKMILCIADILSLNRGINFLTALPSTLEDKIIKRKVSDQGWVLTKEKKYSQLTKDNSIIKLYRGCFPEVLNLSDIIIGLAGTANEQAAGLGKPVISFKGAGPQTTVKRMKEQERLLGGAARFIQNYPGGVADEILDLLDHPKERKRMGEIGIMRMGRPGGSKKIAEFILQKCCNV